MKNIEKFKISFTETIKGVVENMDKNSLGICICVDQNDYVRGIFTEGDFRKAVYKGINLNEKVKKIMNKDYYFLKKNYKIYQAENIFKNEHTNYIPILDRKKLLGLISREKFLKNRKPLVKNLSNVVIIIAGGKGLRLDPFTRILPKPLIPINNEPIIKKIMNEFSNFGMKNFYVTLGDRGKMVKGYFYDHNLPFSIRYSEESKPLGTAGSLSFFNNKFENPVFVTNCDVILKTNYNEILEFHKKSKNDLTIVASMKHVVVPYGICKITKRGNLINITEKPEYDFLANTGFYIMEPKTLSLVPKNRYIDMHNLIKILNNKKRKIGVYPVPSNSWSDVGNWSEYNKSLPRIAAELQKD